MFTLFLVSFAKNADLHNLLKTPEQHLAATMEHLMSESSQRRGCRLIELRRFRPFRISRRGGFESRVRVGVELGLLEA